MAFTDYETEQLRKALLKETRYCAVTLGMKKPSVEQLTKAVGIAKGSFYKVYEAKEMLFVAVLEGIHTELYRVADRALGETEDVYKRQLHRDKVFSRFAVTVIDDLHHMVIL